VASESAGVSGLAERYAAALFDLADERKELDVVRKQGWCLIDQELEDGVRSVAVPIQDAQGKVLAAINVSTHATRVTMQTLREDCLPQLIACARGIDEDLAGGRH
jgi:IclR family pca regulon transcriptional regulator